MAKETIDIKDFELFYEIVKSLTRMADGVKFMFDSNGLVVYAKNDYSKCNLKSNAASSKNPVEFCIAELATFLRILTTVKDMYKDDYGLVKLSYEQPFVRIESGKFKTKVAACERIWRSLPSFRRISSRGQTKAFPIPPCPFQPPRSPLL